MITTYLIVAVACALGLSYLGILHHCWLGESFNEEAPLDRSAKGKTKCEAFIEKANCASDGGREVARTP